MIEKIMSLTKKMESPIAIIGTKNKLLNLGIPEECIGGEWFGHKIIEVSNSYNGLASNGAYIVPYKAKSLEIQLVSGD